MALQAAGIQLPVERSKGPAVLVCNWFLAGAAILIVASRLYIRCAVKRTAWWDDGTVLVSLVIAIVYSAGLTVQVRHGYGRHADELTFNDIATLGVWNSVTNCLNATSLFFIRLSICLLLFRMVKGTGEPKGWFQNFPIWMALFLNVGVVMLSLLIFTTLCFPLKGLWDKTVDATCVDLTLFNDIWRILISINCLVDFMLAIVPCIRVYHLQICGKLRLSVNLLLTCGLVTACMSIGKAKYQRFNSAKDPSWDLLTSSYFAALEMYLAIIFSSIPAISQLYSHFRELNSPSQSILPVFARKDPRTPPPPPSPITDPRTAPRWNTRTPMLSKWPEDDASASLVQDKIGSSPHRDADITEEEQKQQQQRVRGDAITAVHEVPLTMSYANWSRESLDIHHDRILGGAKRYVTQTHTGNQDRGPIMLTTDSAIPYRVL